MPCKKRPAKTNAKKAPRPREERLQPGCGDAEKKFFEFVHDSVLNLAYSSNNIPGITNFIKILDACGYNIRRMEAQKLEHVANETCDISGKTARKQRLYYVFLQGPEEKDKLTFVCDSIWVDALEHFVRLLGCHRCNQKQRTEIIKKAQNFFSKDFETALLALYCKGGQDL